jgi:uncharacterized membrane protein YdbT with pleckstrin-like domain
MFASFAVAGVLLLTIAGLCFALIHHFVLSLVIIGVATVITCGFLAVVSKIYWDNYWIVTDDSLTQMRRSSLFDQEACQLSFANLEDVTATQVGLWAHLFHYGVISAETAAASEKFTLSYCPRPHSFAQKILMAREQFEMGRGARKKKNDEDNNETKEQEKTDSNIDSYEVPD